MLKQIEGSHAVAEAVALCRPQVICAYPISPQTHIVEGLGEMVKSGALERCEFINVESEFAAMSVAIGASAAGVRSYTATASQGLLYMAEAVFNASGLGLPIVMTVANRAIGAPINIWNDHTDAMSQRDCGWIQLFAENNQEALDLHIQAFRLGEELSLPVMVCMDGFILTHAYERVDMPTPSQVDSYLPPFAPRQVLDPAEPVSIGAMVGPEAFMEVRYLAHAKQMRALELIPGWVEEFRAAFGRDSGGLMHAYRLEDAQTVVVALGSVLGTIKDTVDEMRRAGAKIGVLGITCFRPWPMAAVRAALSRAKRVVVIEKSLAVGLGGIVASNIRTSYAGSPDAVHTVVAGLGGRPITRASLTRVFQQAMAGKLEPLTFLDLDAQLVERALAREREQRRSGPLAEGMLRDLGVVAARPV
jgi:pyruvate ferredoxin oxidoreductase alpha subunit